MSVCTWVCHWSVAEPLLSQFFCEQSFSHGLPGLEEIYHGGFGVVAKERLNKISRV